MSQMRAQADIFDRQALIAEVERGMAFTYARFQDQTEDPGGLEAVRNPWREPAAFTLKGITYPTAEHYMMAQKARLFGDEKAWGKILAARSPGAARVLGRAIANFDNRLWRQRRFDIVVEGSHAKFTQNPGLKVHLLQTGNRVLVEATEKDRVWGVGLARTDARISDPRAWLGDNLMGFALMKARAALRQEG